MTARIIDLDVVRARKAQARLPHHAAPVNPHSSGHGAGIWERLIDAPLFDSTPTGIEVNAAQAAEDAEYARPAAVSRYPLPSCGDLGE